MPPSPAAHEISLKQTVHLLDNEYSSFAEGIAQNRYAFWLGSGISRERVADIGSLISKVLEHLRSHIDSFKEHCRYKEALNQALELAHLSCAEKEQIDFASPFVDWPCSENIKQRLQTNYARLLDVQVAGEADDYLLWDGVDVKRTFAAPGIGIDAEHLCVAVLVEEGVVSHIASANWDGLIEKASRQICGDDSSVTVCVKPEDLRAPVHKAYLYKFHGCAVLASEDESYRPYLVARDSQISDWASNPCHAALVNALKQIAATRPTLMIGLSAQDANIKALFSSARHLMGWSWPGDRPSFVFSEDNIGVDQRALLKNVYQDDWTPDKRPEIEAQSLIRAFAKPLLTALVLHVVAEKLKVLANAALDTYLENAGERIGAGITELRDALADAGNGDRLSFMQGFVESSSAMVSLLRDGKIDQRHRLYTQITSGPIDRISQDNSVPASGLREAAVVIGLLGFGQKQGYWTLEILEVDGSSTGIINVFSHDRSAKLVLTANSHTGLVMQQSHGLANSPESIVFYSSEMPNLQTRSPRSSPGRTGQKTKCEISVTELIQRSRDFDELLLSFRQQASI